MKRYSSGLYARLGFAVAIYSSPDIVLVDEVLSVGDAAFRRRALEALRGLIAEGKTVLFISHDMWNVRRLCSDILWMEEGRVRAYGAAGEIAERYMNEVNLEALANQATALQSHRGGTGEVRYAAVDLLDAAGAPTACLTPGDTLVVRATYRAEQRRRRGPVFQVAIVDVDTGLVITTATSRAGDVPATVEGDGAIECRFPRLPLRPRQYVLRLSITDAHQLASYDVVTAGPRFAVTRPRRRRRKPGRRGRRPGVAAVRVRASRAAERGTARVMSTGSVSRVGAARRRRRQHAAHRTCPALLDARPIAPTSCWCRRWSSDAAFVREFDAPARRASRICRRIGPTGLEGAAARADAGRLPRIGRDRVGADPPGGSAWRRSIDSLDPGEARCWRGASHRRSSRPETRYDRHRSPGLASAAPSSCSTGIGRRCSWRRVQD